MPVIKRSLEGGRERRTREIAASRAGLMLPLKTQERGHEPRGEDSHQKLDKPRIHLSLPLEPPKRDADLLTP